MALLVFALAALNLLDGPVHLRSGSEREWQEFPATPAGAMVRHAFEAEANSTECTLLIRQRDVKSDAWAVLLNGRKLGTLLADERDMTAAFAVPAGLLQSGSNTLEITGAAARFSDDIELRAVHMRPQPLERYLRETTVRIETQTGGESLPVRITVVNGEGSLVPFAALRASDREAWRTGVLYTLDGRTELGLPAGVYDIYASRGWEYSAPSRRIRLRTGDTERVQLRLRREVNLPGYVSCDTHVHTLELSGHGDATVRERVITAAGEGVDIIVGTEHNRTTDYSAVVAQLGLDRLLLPVRGNEVTTALGHFNIFPLPANAVPPEHRGREWQTLATTLTAAPGVHVIVQNHPRDVHSGYRPFDPAHHLASAGENLIGRPWFANAVEVINSGAMYSDILRPVLDWLGLLNRGYRVAAIGASDTHTVDFVPIAQARTYIDAGALGSEWRNQPNAVFQRLAAGDNLVSYGLGTTLRVVRTEARNLAAEVEVHGPSWSSADHVTLYANGFAVAEQSLPRSDAAGLKWRRRIEVELPGQDVSLVAVATGPGVRRPFWEVRKPYQPMSREWTPRIIGISKAVRVDLDGNGFKSPHDYAAELVTRHSVAGPEWIADLARYDASVTVQALNLLASRGHAIPELPSGASPAVRTGWAAFESEWKQRNVPAR